MLPALAAGRPYSAADLVGHRQRRMGESAEPARQVAGGLGFGAKLDERGQLDKPKLGTTAMRFLEELGRFRRKGD